MGRNVHILRDLLLAHPESQRLLERGFQALVKLVDARLQPFVLVDERVSDQHARYRPKPDSYGFLRLCRSNRLRPQRCIMVEDSLDNLRTADRLGMKTVWVTRAPRTPGYVDVKIANLMQLPRMLAYLQ